MTKEFVTLYGPDSLLKWNTCMESRFVEREAAYLIVKYSASIQQQESAPMELSLALAEFHHKM